MKKIGYLTGTRADFGLMRLILKEIDKDKKLQLILMATGMHLMDEFGHTISEADKEFKAAKVIEAVFEKDDRESMTRFNSKCLAGVTEALIKLKPDAVMILGDRGEQLAMAIAAAYLAIPLVHLHGGEITTTVDDKARNAISQLADWHLTATKKAKKQLIKMGIEKKKIKVVGAPGLDEAKKLTKTAKKYQLVVLQHPDENEAEAGRQIEETLKAVISFNLPVQIIYPNADAGGRQQIQMIEKYRKKYPKLIKVHQNLERGMFLKLLSQSMVLIGNSSSGLIEAPTLNLPVVNVGPRQDGRERTKNVIDVQYDEGEIKTAVGKALKMTLKKLKSPYGDGKTTKRVIKFLKRL